MRIAIGSIATESCTFSPLGTRLQDFNIARGPDLLESGRYPFLSRYDTTFVPTLGARALPGGSVESGVYQQLKREFLDRLGEAGPLDGLYLDLHGAMNVQGMDDAEGDWATAARQVVGQDCLIAASLDLHGNVSQRLVEQVDLLTAYRTAPHVDVVETRERACGLLIRCLRDSMRPHQAWIPVPVILPGERTSTEWEPGASLYAGLTDVDRVPEILDASILVGYVWADEPRAHASVVVIGTDQAVVEREARRVAQQYWDARADFEFGVPAGSVDECIRWATDAPEPCVFISDSGDNPTAGGVGDVPVFLERLLAAGVSDAVLASIVDAEAVEVCRSAGLNADVSVSLGGKLDPIHGQSLSVAGRVINLISGDPVGGDQAVIQVAGVKVIVTQRRKPFHHLADFQRLGVEPLDHKIVVVKVGYLVPDLKRVAPRAFLALSPGAVDQAIERLPFQRVRRPIFPLDPEMTWEPSLFTVHWYFKEASMSETLLLLPAPRHLSLTGSTLPLSDHRLIVLDGADLQALRFTAARLQQALREHAGVAWDVVAGTAVPQDQIGVTLSVVPDGVGHPQGYELTITETGVHAVAGTPAGAFYAIATLTQMLDQRGRELPTLRLRDWPDFPNRGVMLDISRDKVPTLDTLFDLVDLLASWKVNQLQLYTEHTFAYRNHPLVWAEASPMTSEEILALDAYCRERFVELVPNQNSFGHMHRWLIHDRYRPLAECPDGCVTGWGYSDIPFSLCPLDPGSLGLLRSLYNELLPHFSSRQFNVGSDETVDLGQGRSKDVAAERGVGRLYLDFLLDIYREVKARGRTMQFWGDIIVGYPDLVAELPRDTIALEWGYEADHPFDEHGAVFAASGVPFYVCPGTSSWNSLAGRTENAIGNLRNAAENGLEHGAVGYLNTDWGDRGHWQPLPASYLGFAYGAAAGWAYEANRDLDVVPALNAYAFRDPSGTMGQVAYDLGNAYREAGVIPHNNSILVRILQSSPTDIAAIDGLDEDDLRATLDYIDGVMAPASEAEMQRPDADLIQREFAWAADMLRHGCRRGLWVLGKARGEEDAALRQNLADDADRLIAEFRDVWLARNRPGGLPDSQARMEKTLRAYA